MLIFSIFIQVDVFLSTVWAVTIECKNTAEQMINTMQGQPASNRIMADIIFQREIELMGYIHEKLELAVMDLSYRK